MNLDKMLEKITNVKSKGMSGGSTVPKITNVDDDSFGFLFSIFGVISFGLLLIALFRYFDNKHENKY